jgi:outer membrane protein OmpA-like peptidoglycan-associated protein
VKLMKKELNRTFTLENIYYDLNRWEILPASAAELDKLVAVMRDNPTLSVELGSHTDSRGSDAYNLRLSQQRSESAVAWIIQNGIPADRITARGYGETQLVNQCANGVTCPDEEHRKNRRTEFKITGF